MASYKPKVIALCKQIASEQAGWQFVGGKFVNKVTKDAHFFIEPCFVFKGSYVRFMLRIGVKLPKIVKMVDSVSHLNMLLGFKTETTISEQLKAINLESLVEGRSFVFVGNDATSDELMAHEIHRWLTVGENYLTDTWPVHDLAALFEVMKKSPCCYKGLYATSLCCLAAYLGEFDFIERFYSGELPLRKVGDKFPSLDETDENLLAVLPDWQAQWQATGKIKV